MAGNDQYTKLMLHCDGANASTSFPDVNAGAGAHTVTAGGNAQVSTAQQKFGTGSLVLDATAGTFLTLDGSADFAFGSGDFTIDCWIRLNAVGATQPFYDSRPDVGGGPQGVVFVSTGNVLSYNVSGIAAITGTTAIGAGAWHHVAVARAGTSTKLFLDGTQEGSTFTDNTTYTVGASRPIIGFSGDAATFSFNGWVDEMRVSKGIARWTANFTPPAAPYDNGLNPICTTLQMPPILAQ